MNGVETPRGWGKGHVTLRACILFMGIAFLASAQTIPPSPTPTMLPDYIGQPWKARPLRNSGVPQNPLLAPNPFNSTHNDSWNSDVADIEAPLGRDPAVSSSTLTEARKASPESWIFTCMPIYFDSLGRLIGPCFGSNEATVVLADPQTLEVLSSYALDVIAPGGPPVPPDTQGFLYSMGAIYSYLDNRDQLTIVSGGHHIITLREGGSPAFPVLERVDERSYDLQYALPEGTNLSGLMLDWQGRIWFTTGDPAAIYVLNPATYPDMDVKSVSLGTPENPEAVRNTFALTKSGDAYVVTSKAMYRIGAGSDDQPYVIWSEPYETIGTIRRGQYELGSGTSPTVLGEGKYVAITDNAKQMQVVVFRTDEPLDPNEDRVVCRVPVFQFAGGGDGALSNSLIGSGLSLIASNTYNHLFDWTTGELVRPSAPGFERIDIEPNGRGCSKVWVNTEVATTSSPRLSTKTGLIYLYERKHDAAQNVYVHYWTALDFRTGKTVWQKMAGTGVKYDNWYPAIEIGPNGALYNGVYGGIVSMRDTR